MELKDYIGKEFTYLGLTFAGVDITSDGWLHSQYNVNGVITGIEFNIDQLPVMRSKDPEQAVNNIRLHIFNACDYIQKNLPSEQDRIKVISYLNSIGMECNKIEGISNDWQ